MKTGLLLDLVLVLIFLRVAALGQVSLSMGSGSGSGDDNTMAPVSTSAITPSVSTVSTARFSTVESLTPTMTSTTIPSPPTPSASLPITSSFAISPSFTSTSSSTTMLMTTTNIPSDPTTSIDMDIVKTSMITTSSAVSFLVPFSSTPLVISPVLPSSSASMSTTSAASSFLQSTVMLSSTQITTSDFPIPSTTVFSPPPSSTLMPTSSLIEITSSFVSSSLPFSSTVIEVTTPFTMSSSSFVSKVAVTPTPTFLTSVESSSSTSVSVSQSPSPPIALPPPAGLPIPIIAGTAGGLCVVIVCVLSVVCLLCCCMKKKGKFEILTSGEDGTTLARDYQLQTFNNEGLIKKTEEEAITTGTFGVKSPLVEVDVGGQKFTFPDLPANGESLPALIIVNPVKPDNEVSSNTTFTSHTLPSRKKNKLLTDSDAVDFSADSTLFSPVKTSRSTSELNKDGHPALPTHLTISSDQKASPKASPIYDTPRTFKPIAATEEKEKEKSTETSSTATVTIEPLPKKESPVLTASQQPEPVLEPTKSAVVDRLAPKPSDAAIESIYDNARLIRSKPLAVEQKVLPSQTSSTTASSIYDVPRKLFLQTETPPTKETSSEKSVDSESVSKTVSTGKVEGVYDVPKIREKKETTKTSDISDTQPQPSQTSSSEDKPPLFPKLSQTANKPTEVETAADSVKPSIPSKSAFITAAKNDIVEAAKKLKSLDKEESSSQIDDSKKPQLMPKLNLEVTKHNTNSNSNSDTKPVLLPKPSIIKSDGTTSEFQAEGIVAKPLILPKSKSTTTDTPTVPPSISAKPRIFPKTSDKEKSASPKCESIDGKESSSSEKASIVDKHPQKFPRPKVFPRKSDHEKSASPQCESSDESRKQTESLSSQKASATESSIAPPQKPPRPKVIPRKSDQEKSASPQCESSDESRKETEASSNNGTPEPLASGEDSSNFEAPKPRAKPRKPRRKQVGLPENLMQELFARQKSQSKLSETSPSPADKPLIKPKPNLK